MYRLNIPRTVPLVDWALEHKAGIACVERREAQDNPYFEIPKPGGRSMMDIMERSFALGTWGERGQGSTGGADGRQREGFINKRRAIELGGA